jgi:tol-pal system protein YbgF
VEQLEEQLVDLQVVIGTLESLARTGASSSGGASPPRSQGLSAADGARLDSIETQVRALSLQLEQLAANARGADAGRRSELSKAQGAPGVQFGGPEARQGGASVAGDDEADPIGGLIQNGGLGEAPPAKTGEALPDLLASRSGSPAAGGETAIAGTGEAQGPNQGPNQSPKQLYEAAYGQLLRQDYGAAQAGFIDFLRRYPKDPLAPDALYWLGETHYVQRNYADAAEAFDLVTASYAGSAKAPEAQLKRAMSLAQVGKREEACSALRQLGTKFPNARPVVKSKADAERQRVGCT